MARGRSNADFLFFISDANGRYYYCQYDSKGNPTIFTSAQPIPLTFSPANFEKFKLEFGTNKEYFSLVRNVSYTFEMIKDGADILRSLDYKTTGYAVEAYLTIIKWDGNVLSTPARYKSFYKGRFDLNKGVDVIKSGYKVNTVDRSAWGIVSQNDNIQFKIDCTSANPKAIRFIYDGINLKSTWVFQPIASSITGISNTGITNIIMPIFPVSEDGDSVGITTQAQILQLTQLTLAQYTIDFPNNYFYRSQYAITLRIQDTFSFAYNIIGLPTSLKVKFYRSEHPVDETINVYSTVLNAGSGKISVPIDLTLSLNVGEWIYFDFQIHQSPISHLIIVPDVTNLTVSVITKAPATVCYGLRPLDLLQQLAEKATGGKYTINSNLFTLLNKHILTCGNAIRNAPNAYIISSISDWFKSFNTDYFLAGRLIFGQLWFEQAIEVYKQTTNIFSLGEITDVEISQASEYFLSQIMVGSPKQSYSHTSGRLEFNTTNKFSVEQFNVKRVMELVSVYRKDCYGQEFIRVDHQQGSTQDNSGDTDTFIVDITDETEESGVPVENFVDVTVDIAPLAPLIRYPFNNDTISNDKPTLHGVCQPSTTVNIYVDGSLDGTTVSDIDGNWIYDIVNSLASYYFDGVSVIFDGIHTISATFTDLTGTTTDIIVVITSDITPITIQYPANNDNIYNNKPLIRGFAQAGTPIVVNLDGVFIGATTADGSGRWFLQSPVIYNGSHFISVSGQVNFFDVNSFVSIPLITSFDDGFIIVNNLPLIEGVALPGTTVYIFVNYYPDFPAGSAVADANGNWSFQPVPLFKTGGIDYLTPLPNGDNIISTSLTIDSVIINIKGYKLNRPNYDSITGVIDNTVFNVELSPKRSLEAWIPFFKGIFYQQPNTIIQFQGSDKNQDLSTTIGGVTISEKADLKLSDYPNIPALFLPKIATFKTKIPLGYETIMDNFSAGGVIPATYLGNDVYLLPIGDMSVEDVTNDVQKWKLLISAQTPLLTLLALSKAGITFTLMTGAIYRSDYNSLHFVKYNYTISPQFTQAELYDDWFENRSERWVHGRIKPYIQKFKDGDVVIDQIITNGVSGISLKIYRCSDAKLINTLLYSPVVPNPTSLPDVVYEVTINMGSLGIDQFFSVISVGGVDIAISERFEIGDYNDTILINASHSSDKTGAFFSTGFKSIYRVEGLVEKLQPVLENLSNEDEKGEHQLLHSVSTRKRNILFGDASGMPDYAYLKIALFLGLDNLIIENVRYVIPKDAKIEPIDKFDGYPYYAYSIEAMLYDNNLSNTFDAQTGNFQGGVIVVVDADAFGLGDGLVNIQID